ncbi:hypothetical protein Vadar_025591 [Vaccinium darrowii]|uniref:Uncharacterized protein n=1 Tax=Vaccinium darrowii TaxID=229202 RepID=A0ACB7XCF7_9ERIC|nr:hypothetical protein Vadar_025591 [Vaccinium darrowii]
MAEPSNFCFIWRFQAGCKHPQHSSHLLDDDWSSRSVVLLDEKSVALLETSQDPLKRRICHLKTLAKQAFSIEEIFTKVINIGSLVGDIVIKGAESSTTCRTNVTPLRRLCIMMYCLAVIICIILLPSS